MNIFDYFLALYLLINAVSGYNQGIFQLWLETLVLFVLIYLLFHFSYFIGSYLAVADIIINKTIITGIGGSVLLLAYKFFNGFAVAIILKILPNIENRILKIITGITAGAIKGLLFISLFMFLGKEIIELENFGFYQNSKIVGFLEQYQPETKNLINYLKEK